ncbi:MAG: DNA helicase [Planctomycetes bacterium]|nr:DNA helicase [Planctomycetota bacterium]
MSKESTLKKIKDDIARGDLGKARDRLHGLIHAYPDDPKLRILLGEIYHNLQFPAMAGRYWYLEENKTPEMQSACEAFEKDRGMDPFRILAALQFRGDYKCLNEFARTKIHALENESSKKHIRASELKPAGKPSKRKKIVVPDWASSGCMILIIVILLLAIIGFISLF